MIAQRRRAYVWVCLALAERLGPAYVERRWRETAPGQVRVATPTGTPDWGLRLTPSIYRVPRRR